MKKLTQSEYYNLKADFVYDSLATKMPISQKKFLKIFLVSTIAIVALLLILFYFTSNQYFISLSKQVLLISGILIFPSIYMLKEQRKQIKELLGNPGITRLNEITWEEFDRLSTSQQYELVQSLKDFVLVRFNNGSFLLTIYISIFMTNSFVLDDGNYEITWERIGLILLFIIVAVGMSYLLGKWIIHIEKEKLNSLIS